MIRRWLRLGSYGRPLVVSTVVLNRFFSWHRRDQGHRAGRTQDPAELVTEKVGLPRSTLLSQMRAIVLHREWPMDRAVPRGRTGPAGTARQLTPRVDRVHYRL